MNLVSGFIQTPVHLFFFFFLYEVLSFAENAPLERLSFFFHRNKGQNVQCVKIIIIIHASCLSEVLYVWCYCLVFLSLQVSFFRPMPARVESWKWKHGYAAQFFEK